MTNPLLANDPIGELFGSLHLAPRQAHKTLTLWPLLRDAPCERRDTERVVLLAEAIAAGRASLDEVGDGGFVPLARLDNRGELPVLVLFGEEILGAKQNRVANASVLVAPGTGVVLDVTCVERGRWARTCGGGFRAAGRTISSDLRRRMQHDVARAVRAGLGFEADQLDVWDDVEARIDASAIRSQTLAWQDYASARAPEIDEVLESFHTLEGQVGFVAAVGDEIVGIELLGDPSLLPGAFARLASGTVIDAIDRAALEIARDRARRRPKDPWLDEPSPEADPTRETRRPLFEAPEPFLAAIARAAVERRPSRGLGDDLRLEGRGVAACALDWNGIVHLSGFVDPAS